MALFNKEPEKNPKIQPATTPSSFTYIASASSIDFLLAGCDGSASQRTCSRRGPRIP